MITNFKIYEKDTYYGKNIIDAAINDDEDLLERLIEHGANLDILSGGNKTSLPKTALMILSDKKEVLRRNEKVKLHNRMVRKLINAGANIDIIAPNNFTALMYASLSKSYNIREMLIQAGANWNVYNHQNKGFLDFLAINYQTSTKESDQKTKVIERYPEKYQEYLKQKELDIETKKYNI